MVVAVGTAMKNMFYSEALPYQNCTQSSKPLFSAHCRPHSLTGEEEQAAGSLCTLSPPGAFRFGDRSDSGFVGPEKHMHFGGPIKEK